MYAKLTQVPHIDGKMRTVGVGDVVGFKCDIEQYQQIVAIKGTRLYFQSDEGFEGEYIRNATEHSEEASDCWVD